MAAELDKMVRSNDGAWLHNDDCGWYFPSNFEMNERTGSNAQRSTLLFERSGPTVD